jgi:hypothetical protein
MRIHSVFETRCDDGGRNLVSREMRPHNRPAIVLCKWGENNVKHAVCLFCRRSVPGLFVKVSRAVGVSVFADLTGRNVPERCTHWMGYRILNGCGSNWKAAVVDREVNFVSDPVISSVANSAVCSATMP